MVFLACLLYRIDVYDRPAQVGKVVHKTVVDLARYGVPFCHGQPRVHRHVDLGVQPVAQPARPYLGDVFDAWGLASRAPYLFYDLGLHPVEHG